MVLAACTGQSGENAALPSVTPSASASAPSETPSTEPSVTPEASVSPSPTRITADDLIVALPTNKQMSKIQGFKFKESSSWESGKNEGPQWINNAPLTKSQKNMARLGTYRTVKPDKCTASALSFGYGVPQRWATPAYISAVGYSLRVNDDRSFSKQNTLKQWTTAIYMMPLGEGNIWIDNIANLWETCKKMTLVKRNGDIEKEDLVEFLSDTTREKSGAANVVMFTSSKSKKINNSQLVGITEAIGNALTYTAFSIIRSDADALGRASDVYNVLADNLAEVQGVTREPIDLLKLEKSTPDPDAYMPIPVPSNELA